MNSKTHQFVLLTLFILSLIGCSSVSKNRLDYNQINHWFASQNPDAITSLPNNPLYLLEYTVNNQHYSYATYYVPDKYKAIQLLIREQILIAISVTVDDKVARNPELKKCTVVPLPPSLDVAQCLQQFTQTIIKAHDPNWRENLKQIDVNEHQRRQRTARFEAAQALIISPILVPFAIFSLPLMAFDSLDEDKENKKPIAVKLGHNPNLPELLRQLPNETQSIIDDRGSVFIEVDDRPVTSFGFKGMQIIWIQKSPSYYCGVEIIKRGVKCTLGNYFHYNKNSEQL